MRFFCLVAGLVGAGVLIFSSILPAAEVRVWKDPVAGIEFVWLPGGSFIMGQSEQEKKLLIKALGRDKYEKYCACECPQHKVTVSPFWIGRYEVTNAQYRLFVTTHDSGLFQGFSLNGDRQPVVEVSWNEAAAYADWLSRKCNRRFRLPTEAEWEYACRAGTTSIRYWRDDESACLYANIADLSARNRWPMWSTDDCEDGFPVTAPVGSFRPNAFGLYDMLGNVWEWCSDWYAKNYYRVSPENNPRGVEAGKYHIARGSCWDNPPRYVRSASRNYRLPGNHNYGIGFRLVLEDDGAGR